MSCARVFVKAGSLCARGFPIMIGRISGMFELDG